MRLIDADKLKVYRCDDSASRATFDYIYEDDVEDAPTIEPTIDLVRCGECKYWDGIECQNDRASTDLEGGAEYALYRDDTDFCSYGERKEGE